MPQNKIIYGPGRVPQASEFAIGEIIINLDDAKVYSKDKQNTVFELVGGGEGDGFKNVYLSSLIESGSLSGNPLVVTQGTTGLTGSEGLDIDTDFLDDLRVGDTIKIVSGAFSSFHEITSIDSDVRADFTPAYQNNSINVGAFDDTNITIMARNPSGSILITSSVENRNLIFSGSSGVSVITGSEPNSIEISIDGTAISAQSDNIEGTLFTAQDTGGQTGVNFNANANDGVESGETITATVPNLGAGSNVTFNNLTIGNITSDGTITFSGLDDVTTENHVLVFNSSNNQVDYIPTSSLIPRLQNPLVAKINPYNPGGDIIHDRVGGVDHNDSFAVGTSLEQILRDILIEFLESNITSTLGFDGGSNQEVPIDGNKYREPGDGVTIDRVKILVSQDSDGEYFGTNASYDVILSGLSDNNPYESITVFDFGSEKVLAFSDALDSYSPMDVSIDRNTAGTVSITAEGEDPTVGYTATGTTKAFFEHPVFCGSMDFAVAAANPLYDDNVGPPENFDQYLTSLTASGNAGEVSNVGTENPRDVATYEYENTVLISHRNGVATEEEPSNINFPQITNTERGIVVDTGLKSNNPGHYTFIAYPKSYGLLTGIITETFAVNIIDEFTDIEERDVTRFGVTTPYYVCRTIADAMFQPNTKLTIRN